MVSEAAPEAARSESVGEKGIKKASRKGDLREAIQMWKEKADASECALEGPAMYIALSFGKLFSSLREWVL